MREALVMKEGTASTKLMAAAQLLLAGNLRAAGLAFKGFFVSMGPIGWATLAMSGLASAIALFLQPDQRSGKISKIIVWPHALCRDGSRNRAAPNSTG